MSKNIKLSGFHDAVEFVHAAESCDFDVDVKYDRIVIDGKSIVGVCSLDFSHVLTVIYGGKNPVLEQVLEKYQVA